ncbi:hypothetical protein QAD02_004208 [Eretmocerus hayati]|uniref:Uncharacterized protein n=1 Tax=Eretmocerus hayati TaxID=131215 RepID=A0ACC2NPB5_9HYME|nr:hypothetical protein QAD02_004208 [Eretmocerus hayati]
MNILPPLNIEPPNLRRKGITTSNGSIVRRRATIEINECRDIELYLCKTLRNTSSYVSKRIPYVKESYGDESCTKKAKKRNSGEVSSSKIERSKNPESDSSDDCEVKQSPIKKIKSKKIQQSHLIQVEKRKGSDPEFDDYQEQELPTKVTVTAVIETNEDSQDHEGEKGSGEDVSHGSSHTLQHIIEDEEVEIMSEYGKTDDDTTVESSSESK